MNIISPPNSQTVHPFSQRLLDWYGQNARTMPWRIPPQEHAQGVRQDPYKVWLSEIMLQQTQVATVKAYFLKFMQLWPTIHDLAAAHEEDILTAWAGLGYYSRARNLKKCADIVVADHGGTFPSTHADLMKLPGIGDYTASAIASIAFDQPVPVIDGNVERVLARYQRIETPFPKAKPVARSMLADLLDRERPGEFAQAMMDLGATLCAPKKPSCPLCPLRNDCQAFANADMENYPYKLPKKQKPTRKGAAFVIRNKTGEVFLCKRPDEGLLAGMTQVPTTDWTARTDGVTDISGAPVSADWSHLGVVKHTFTHFHLELEIWGAENCQDVDINGWWSNIDTLDNEALPTIMRKVLKTAIKQ